MHRSPCVWPGERGVRGRSQGRHRDRALRTALMGSTRRCAQCVDPTCDSHVRRPSLVDHQCVCTRRRLFCSSTAGGRLCKVYSESSQSSAGETEPHSSSHQKRAAPLNCPYNPNTQRRTTALAEKKFINTGRLTKRSFSSHRTLKVFTTGELLKSD